MENPIVRYNFGDTTGNGYRDLYRYKWRAADFDTMQALDIQARVNGAMEGLTRGSVYSGAELVSITGLNFSIASGIAVSPTGALMVLQETATGTLPSPTAAAGACHLVVLRPASSASAYITKPSDPGNLVPLVYADYAEVVVIDGNSAGGGYPAKGDADVVLFAVRLANAAASFTEAANVSRQEREIPGRSGVATNAGLGALPMAFDRRLYPYRSGSNSIGIMPSQTIKPFPKNVLYLSSSSGVASKFPRAAGSFNGDAGDTLLNFTTGAITGADTTSPDFTPTLPSANNFIWALVTIGPSTDVLAVSYGTTGTLAQCLAGLRDQTIAGAGSIPTATTSYRVALVLVGSSNGTAATFIDVYDVRGFNPAPSGTASAITALSSADSPYTMTGAEDVLQIDASGGAVAITLPARASNQGRKYAFDRIDGTSANAVTVTRAGSDTLAEPDATTVYPIDVYESFDFFAGTTKWKVRG